MSTETQPIVEFLNRGVLPFSGRDDERRELLRFWSQTLDRDRLGLLLLQGEAGVGKSRLLEETMPVVLDEGGSVIHTRFYPESSTSFVSLVAEALSTSRQHRSLLVETPEPEVGSLVAALRRIARLRATLLIVEDVHLLESDGLSEMAGILRALSDEHLSVICAERPVDSPARSILEPFLIEEVKLAPFDRAAVTDLWSHLFGAGSTDALEEALYEATLGNPLAIRSAMRGALKQAAVGGIIDPSALENNVADFRSGVERYADGLASHLDDEERRAAAMLAQLGEVIDRGAGEDFLDVSEMFERSGSDLISSLRFKGVLATPTTGVRSLIRGPERPAPLCFTHSLFHRQMLEEAEVDHELLLRHLSHRTTLYSVTPYQLLIDCRTLDCSDVEIIGRFVENGQSVVSALNGSTDWRLMDTVEQGVGRVVERCGPSIPEADLSAIERMQLLIGLSARSHKVHDPEFHRIIDALLEATADPTDAESAVVRLIGLRHHYWINRSTTTIDEACRPVDRLVEAFPSLLRHPQYANFLLNLSRPNLIGFDLSTIDRVTERWERAGLDDAGLSDDPLVDYHLLHCFSYRTPEEFARRSEEFAEIDRMTGWRRIGINFLKLIWFYTAVMPEQYLAHAGSARRRAEETGTVGNARHVILESISARALLGAPVEEIAAELRSLVPKVGQMAGYGLGLAAEALVLRNEIDAARALLALGDRPVAEFAPMRLLIPLDRPERSERVGRDDLYRLEQAIIEGDEEDIARIAEAFFELDGLHYGHIIESHAARALLERHGRLDGPLAEMAAAQLDATIDFLTEPSRGVESVAAGLIEQHGHLLPEKRRNEYLRRVETNLESPGPETTDMSVSDTPPLRLSMIGEIAVATADAPEPTRLRGARLRTIIGLLVVEHLLDRPLEPTEFIRIAVEEIDPEKGRRSMKAAVHRLREVVGKEAITVSEGRPHLAEEVDVDLLAVVAAIDEAIERRDRGDLAGSVQRIESALGPLGTDVILPGLYDRMFEAARDEVEGRLRDVAVGLLGDLLDADDFEVADRLAAALLERMPEDEEIVTLRHRSLVNLGRLADAEKMRMTSL